MNPIRRFVRSMRRSVAPHDAGFEAYYGAIIRQDGGPNAEEARRDYQNAQRLSLRATMYN